MRRPGPGAALMTERVLGAIAALALFAMMALTFLAVVGRYFLNRPIAGSEEIQGFLLGFIIFAALPLVTRAERHIAIRSFAAMLRGRALFAQRVLVLAATAGGFAFIGLLILHEAETMREDGSLSNFLDIPEAPFVYAFAALTLVAALAALARLVAVWRGSADTAAPSPDRDPC
jgi:TRAP-type transport system small permease protein